MNFQKENTLFQNEKVKKVLYVGISIPNDKIMLLPLKQEFLENKKLNKEFHVTLVFKPKEEHLVYYNEFLGKEVEVTIDGCGYTNNAVSLLVDSLQTMEGINVANFQDGKPLHITVALKEGIKPVDSYHAIEENLVKFESPLPRVVGTLKYY